MSTTDILEAALQKLQAFSYSPLPEIMWPGIQETPPEEGMWLEARLFPGDPTDIAWDNDACVDTRGWFQISVYFRPGQGQIEPSELADALIAYFPKGSVLGTVRIKQRPYQKPMIAEDASKCFIDVIVPYMGLT